MVEIYHIFNNHVDKVDRVDEMVSNYKMSMAPIEISSHELAIINNPRSVLWYRDRVDLNLESYI